ncbi:hypothetical protein KIPB_003666 [Kipferlia bialata]|uniref:RNA polymerase II-associated protein 3 n=1 Tax=Kipferlia bialata TaxID=797122 RepID=A0A9K3GH76_9EUKA|nr:hypothetical protein KIPB_003666 [Kipferlia bialata]|eukprot:g3666.t1
MTLPANAPEAVTLPAVRGTETDQTPDEQAEIYREAGNKLFRKKKYLAAAKQYTMALEAFPHCAAAASNRAACYEKQGRPKKVVADCDLCIRIDPTYMKAYFRRGRARMGLSQWKPAYDDLVKALHLCGDNETQKASVMALIEECRPHLPKPKVVVQPKVLSRDSVSVTLLPDEDEAEGEGEGEAEGYAEEASESESESDEGEAIAFNTGGAAPMPIQQEVVEPTPTPAPASATEAETKTETKTEAPPSITPPDVIAASLFAPETKGEGEGEKKASPVMEVEVSPAQPEVTKVTEAAPVAAPAPATVMRLPPPPRSGVAFRQDLALLANHQRTCCEYLMSFKPQEIPKLVSQQLEDRHVVSVVDALHWDEAQDTRIISPKRKLNTLFGLTKAHRFDMISGFLSDTTKAQLAQILRESLKADLGLEKESTLKRYELTCKAFGV